MKVSRFMEDQKAFGLGGKPNRLPVTEICSKAGSSQMIRFSNKKRRDGLLSAAESNWWVGCDRRQRVLPWSSHAKGDCELLNGALMAECRR